MIRIVPAQIPPGTALRTARLILRRQQVTDAAIFRQLWTERDDRVPPHRRIGPDGRPSVDDIAAHILDEQDSAPGLLTVQRIDTGDVIGYSGVVFDGNGAPDEPELAFELLQTVHNRGYATEAGQAVLDWAAVAGYPQMWASVWDWNAASRRVLEKLGFVDGRRLSTDRTCSPSARSRPSQCRLSADIAAFTWPLDEAYPEPASGQRAHEDQRSFEEGLLAQVPVAGIP